MPFEHASVAASGNDPRPFALTSFLSVESEEVGL
jgi:hypothetical protein